jgi:glycosyltransferase involved in cell wall biosynthesis
MTATRASDRRLRSIAFVDPLSDPGIGTYTHELAEAMQSLGITADVYSSGTPWATRVPGTHRLFPVLGSLLFAQRDVLRTSLRHERTAPAAHSDQPDPTSLLPLARRGIINAHSLLGPVRPAVLSLELALWLRLQKYDVVWTQWPDMGPEFPHFWRVCRRLGLRVVHTVHNVCPHERSNGDSGRYGRVYAASDALIVHSDTARRVLTREFPGTSTKAIMARHGAYTVYPRRPEAREVLRARLGVAPRTPLALFFGGVREYKNLDAVLEAIRAEPDSSTVLLVAGAEIGYANADQSDRLARTRRQVREMGIEHRVRLLAGPFGMDETSEIFEAADSVLLPYIQSYGSGLLLLAMTFEKFVIATSVGGMDEYLHEYPASVLLARTTPRHINDALRQAAMAPRGTALIGAGTAAANFGWQNIVAGMWPELTHKLGFAG